MRWYKLTIGNNVFSAGQSNLLKNIMSNSAELNIRFDVKVFESNSASIIGTFQIFNVSLEWFLQAQSKKDLAITLEAGFSENSPLVKKCNYSKATNNVLINGVVQNMIGDFNDILSVVTIYYVPISSVNVANYDLKLSIETNDKPAQKIIDYLTKQNLGLTFKTTDVAKNLTYSGGSLQVKGNSLTSFLKECESIVFKTQDTNTNIKHTITNYSECILYSDMAEIAGATHTIKADDFIKQPQMIDFSGTLQCTIRLSPDFKVGDIVNISGVTPAIQGAYTSIKALTSSQDTTKLFYTGAYRIKSINHLGEYYNIAPDSWTTQIECVPTDDTLSKIGVVSA